MGNKIQLTPGELKTQAAELQTLSAEYDALFGTIIGELESVNTHWSPNLAHNFTGKITSAQNKCKHITHMLDAGAKALIVPHVNTVDEVKKLISYGKFAPLGNRGYCASADGGWGRDACYAEGMEGYMRMANERTLLIPQCETMGCLENLEEIVNLDGVAGIFIGPYDLSIAMGIPGQFEHPDHIAAIERIRKVCAEAGKLCIVFCDSAEKANAYFRQGFPNVTLSVDAFMLLNAVSALVDTAKEI